MSITYTEPNYRKKQWLKNEYISNNRSIRDLAEECKVSRGTIRNWTAKFRLRKRFAKSTDYRDKEWLYEEYIAKNKTRGEIAKKQGVCIDTIAEWLTRYEIKKVNY